MTYSSPGQWQLPQARAVFPEVGRVYSGAKPRKVERHFTAPRRKAQGTAGTHRPNTLYLPLWVLRRQAGQQLLEGFEGIVRLLVAQYAQLLGVVLDYFVGVRRVVAVGVDLQEWQSCARQVSADLSGVSEWFQCTTCKTNPVRTVWVGRQGAQGGVLQAELLESSAVPGIRPAHVLQQRPALAGWGARLPLLHPRPATSVRTIHHTPHRAVSWPICGRQAGVLRTFCVQPTSV
jgi:hypothetical protein